MFSRENNGGSGTKKCGSVAGEFDMRRVGQMRTLTSYVYYVDTKHSGFGVGLGMKLEVPGGRERLDDEEWDNSV